MITQHSLTLGGRRFSYLDLNPAGVPLLALHGTFGRGRGFAPLAQLLAPDYRVIALDQRGHGRSEHGGDFSREAFVEDAAAFIRHLDVGPVHVLGHSLGGVNAFQLAAWHPDLVQALVVEDAPTSADGILDITDWPRETATREELAAFLASRGVPAIGYFLDSAYEHDGAWRLRFDYADMMATQRGNVGDWSADWLASTQPALLLRATESMLLSTERAREMAARRPNTTLVEFPGCGHWIHRDDPTGHALAVRRFLDLLIRS